MLGIANSLFDGHVCAVQLKRTTSDALPVPLAKTGFCLAVFRGPKKVLNIVTKMSSQGDSNGPQMGTQMDQKWFKKGVQNGTSKQRPLWESSM